MPQVCFIIAPSPPILKQITTLSQFHHHRHQTRLQSPVITVTVPRNLAAARMKLYYCLPVIRSSLYGERLICKVQRMRRLYKRSTINLCSRNSNNINHISQEFGHIPQIIFFIFFDFTSFSKYEISCPCLLSTLFTFFACGL